MCIENNFILANMLKLQKNLQKIFNTNVTLTLLI